MVRSCTSHCLLSRGYNGSRRPGKRMREGAGSLMRISSECETALSDAEPRLLISSSDKRATQSRRSPRLQVGPTNAVYNPAFGAQQLFESGDRESGEPSPAAHQQLHWQPTQRTSHERAGDLSWRLRMDRSRPPSAGFMMRAAGHWQPGMAEGAEPHRSCRPRFQDRESGTATGSPLRPRIYRKPGAGPRPGLGLAASPRLPRYSATARLRPAGACQPVTAAASTGTGPGGTGCPDLASTLDLDGRLGLWKLAAGCQ